MTVKVYFGLICKYFLPFNRLPFLFLMFSSAMLKLFKFDVVPLFIFAFIVFGVKSKEIIAKMCLFFSDFNLFYSVFGFLYFLYTI